MTLGAGVTIVLFRYMKFATRGVIFGKMDVVANASALTHYPPVYSAACQKFARIAVAARWAVEFYGVTSPPRGSRDYGMQSRDLAMASMYVYSFPLRGRRVPRGMPQGGCLRPQFAQTRQNKMGAHGEFAYIINSPLPFVIPAISH